MHHVVMFSSGIGSWAAAKRVAERHGTDNLTLLFADTLIEDEDNYRFLDQAAANVGGKLVRIADGRTPWEVFRDERMIGNSRVASCSKILKGRMADRFFSEKFSPDSVIRYVGISWDEIERLDRLREKLPEWTIEAPMCEPPYLSKKEMLDWCRSEGIEPPRLYAMGFPHANCGGFCVKAGQAHFRLLLEKMPKRYAYHEAQEQAMREYLGRDDIAIMSETRNGKKIPLTMAKLRERVEARQATDLYDWGGCGCYLDDAA